MSIWSRVRRITPQPTLREQFDRNEGRLADKWLHYFPIYERHLGPFRGRAPRILEIGVSHGGSIDLWLRYFGHGVEIVGIDIAERARALAEPGVAILIGDQGDPDFLDSVVRDHGPFDIVIDDGSHRSAHQRCSLERLWPAVAEGGVYLVEDLHANYWPEYDGGLRRDGSFIEFTKGLVDDLHAFHTDELEPSEWTKSVGGLHVYDSVVVLDREQRSAPVSRMTGRPTFPAVYGVPFAEHLDADHLRAIDEMNRPSRRLRRIATAPRRSLRRVRARRRLPADLRSELL